MLKEGQIVTQNDINTKLFENLEKLDERMERFEAKLDAKMERFETKLDAKSERFEAKITAQMNWQLAIFTVIMVGVLAKVITA